MRSKKKFTVAILALALVAVAAVTSVIAVLAATQTTVQNTFTITYTAARNVVASVRADHISSSFSTTDATSVKTTAHNAIYTPFVSTGEGHFDGLELTGSSLTISDDNITLGNDANGWSQYLVLRFMFGNNTANASHDLKVVLSTNGLASLTQAVEGNNVKIYHAKGVISDSSYNQVTAPSTVPTGYDIWTTRTQSTGVGVADKISTPGESPTDISFVEGNNATTPAWTSLTTDGLTVPKDQTGFIYIVFIINDFQKSTTLSNVNLSWTLTVPTAS